MAATVAVAVLLVGGGAVAWASSSDDPPAPGHEGGGHHDNAGRADDGGRGDGGGQGRRRHREHHGDVTPYPERYAAASADERDAADLLVAGTEDALAAYADVDAAVAAGYEAPRNPRGNRAHYLNPSLVRDGDLLDTAHPEGLVYFTGGDGDPVLLGAFFVAPRGSTAPTPAGDLVVWHSHNERCPGFFATEDEPCTDARRMLHVWTIDEVQVPRGRRGGGRAGATVPVVDPFGTPFRAALGSTDPASGAESAQPTDPAVPAPPVD